MSVYFSKVDGYWLSFLFYFSLSLYGGDFDPYTLQAERLFEEHLYLDALPFYRNLYRKELLAGHSEDANFYIIRLAICQIELKRHLETLFLLESPFLPFSSTYISEKKYLLAVAYRQLGLSHCALKALQTVPLPHNHLQPAFYLEAGLNRFYLNQFLPASQRFKAVNLDPLNSSLYCLAQIYLARLALINHQPKAAQTYLSKLNLLISKENPLRIEISYLEGLCAWLNQHYTKALALFEEALFIPYKQMPSWKKCILHMIATTCLKLVEEPSIKQTHKNALFIKAEQALQQKLAIEANEEGYLTLAELYLAKARHFKDKQFYLMTNHLLKEHSKFFTLEGQRHVRLLEAESAFSSIEKSQIYAELTQVLRDDQSNLLDHALKYKALSYYYEGSSLSKQEAWKMLTQLLHQPDHTLSLDEIEELYDLSITIGLDLLKEQEIIHKEELEKTIFEALAIDLPLNRKERLYKALALYYFYTKQFSQADQQLNQWLHVFPNTAQQGEIWLWKAKCAEELSEREKMRSYLKIIYENYPQSPHAPLAYLHHYSQAEYMQDQKEALKHLKKMPEKFPGHPHLILAYFLMGLHAKKNHSLKEDQVSDRRDWIAAIDAFQEVESLFASLYTKSLIPIDSLPYFTQLRYRSQLERALANQAIADESLGTKKQIYLDYAETSLKQMIEDFYPPNFLFKLLKETPNDYPEILEEAEFYLAQVQLKQGKGNEANQTWEKMLEHYQQAGIQSHYWLSQLWYERGVQAQLCQDYERAIEYFSQAQLTSQGLSSDQKLNMWIQKALCYKELERFEEAMRLLSEVINDESVSGLRIQAMLIRADIYELQGKLELAYKQLEAVARKGGDWSIQAQERISLLQNVYNLGF